MGNIACTFCISWLHLCNLPSKQKCCAREVSVESVLVLSSRPIIPEVSDISWYLWRITKTVNTMKRTYRPTLQWNTWSNMAFYLFFTSYKKKHVNGAYFSSLFNPLNPELNPICYLLALLGAQHFLHVSRIRVKSLTIKLLMSYIYIWSTYSWCF